MSEDAIALGLLVGNALVGLAMAAIHMVLAFRYAAARSLPMTILSSLIAFVGAAYVVVYIKVLYDEATGALPVGSANVSRGLVFILMALISLVRVVELQYQERVARTAMQNREGRT